MVDGRSEYVRYDGSVLVIVKDDAGLVFSVSGGSADDGDGALRPVDQVLGDGTELQALEEAVPPCADNDQGGVRGGVDEQ